MADQSNRSKQSGQIRFIRYQNMYKFGIQIREDLNLIISLQDRDKINKQ
ncbi:unnamed protein product [Paramecium sonneborni]|uniref:Uncharacterized protein n=1 Tax=Paramecium sonneborni TaxID=65129 RepID=A0A8S1RJM9_9CILI|nr:unnamed protein product [Paramecium sonneborni]